MFNMFQEYRDGRTHTLVVWKTYTIEMLEDKTHYDEDKQKILTEVLNGKKINAKRRQCNQTNQMKHPE